MSDVTIYIISAAVAIMVLGIQFFLSKQKNWVLGGIIPLGIIILTVYAFNFTKLTFSFNSVLPFIIYFFWCLQEWDSGRKNYKKAKKTEMQKMKAYDID